MNIGTFSAEHFSEDTSLFHIERSHLEIVVAAVFENHTVLAGLFRQVDKAPAFVKVHCRGDFDGSVLTVFECALCYGEMMVPVGGYVDEVDVRTLAELFVSLFSIVNLCGGKTFFAHVLLAAFSAFFFEVAECNDFHSGNVGKAHYRPRSTHAEADEAYADGFHFFVGETENMLLACGACRGVYNDGSLVPMPLVLVGAVCLCGGRCHTEYEQRRSYNKTIEFHVFYFKGLVSFYFFSAVLELPIICPSAKIWIVYCPVAIKSLAVFTTMETRCSSPVNSMVFTAEYSSCLFS